MSKLSFHNILAAHIDGETEVVSPGLRDGAPSIPRLSEGLRSGFTDDEKRSISESDWCARMIAASWSEAPPSIGTIVSFLAAEAPHLAGAMKRHAEESIRTRALLESSFVKVAAAARKAGKEIKAALLEAAETVGTAFTLPPILLGAQAGAVRELFEFEVGVDGISVLLAETPDGRFAVSARSSKPASLGKFVVVEFAGGDETLNILTDALKETDPGVYGVRHFHTENFKSVRSKYMNGEAVLIVTAIAGD